MFDGAKNKLAAFAQDLLQLEINTIIDNTITGRSQPMLPLAVLEIFECYLTWLEEKGWLVRPADDIRGLPLVGALKTVGDIARNRKEENKAVDGGTSPLSESDRAMLTRIIANTSTIGDLIQSAQEKAKGWINKLIQEKPKGWFNELRKKLTAGAGSNSALKLFTESPANEVRSECENNPTIAEELDKVHITPAGLAELAKIWELGTDVVVMQTVVFVGCDVVTRISEKYATQEYSPLHGVHFENVKISIKTWVSLVKLVGEVASGLVSSARRR